LEKNVGSVDLAELMKAREEMNRDMGIETDPNMYSDYNPNRKLDENSDSAQTEEVNETHSILTEENVPNEEKLADSGDLEEESQNGLQDFSVEQKEVSDNNNSSLDNSLDLSDYNATNGEVDFSVYDSFADFEISENADKSSNEANETEVQKTAETDENISDNKHLETENISDENKPSNKEDYSDVFASLDEFLVANSDKESEQTTENLDNKSVENSAIQEEKEQPKVDLEEKASSLKELEDILGFSDFNLSSEDDDNAELDNLDSALPDEHKQVEEEKPEKSVELQAEQPKQNASEEQKETETKKFVNEFNSSTDDSEKKINSVIATLTANREEQNSIPVQTAVYSGKQFGTISNADFVDIIGSHEFENLDKFSYILGINEAGKYEFASIKQMYNVALFSRDEMETNKFFNSLILSLMLKNNYNDIKFYISDNQVNSSFKKYNSSAYLGRPVSTNYDDTLSLLTSLISDIDERYETIAAAGLRNVEEYNKAMAESYIIGYPYSLLIFNNYANITHIETYNKIKECLAYILKYGRLVGVYCYIKATSEITDEKINYNLATRVAFRAETSEDSVKQVGDEGAEKLAENGEFVFKTIYGETLNHIKLPNITDREVELLIQNIER